MRVAGYIIQAFNTVADDLEDLFLTPGGHGAVWSDQFQDCLWFPSVDAAFVAVDLHQIDPRNVRITSIALRDDAVVFNQGVFA